MEHLARIQKTIDLIEERLKEELPVETLAKTAAFSVWHFQRVFSATVGDTLMGYVRQRRLTQALRELQNSERRILDIALDYQFESQEAFTRAFKAQFGLTPGACRKPGAPFVLALTKPKITMEYLDHLYGGITMEPKYVTLPEKKIVGMASTFISVRSPDKNNMQVIPALWDRYLKHAREIPNRKNPHSLGICQPVAEGERKHPEECYYMAGAEVSEFGALPPGMETKIVPAGQYAIFTHRGKIETVEHTMNYIFGSWLPKSGKQLREAPDLEVYDERFVYGSDSSELDIYIPIV